MIARQIRLTVYAFAFILWRGLQAHADVIVSLEPEGGDTLNHAYVTAGEVVYIDVHVIVTSDSIAKVGNEGVQQLAGNYYSGFGGLQGDLAPAGDPVRSVISSGIFGLSRPGVGVNGFSASGSQAAAIEDMDGDGDLDLAPFIPTGWSFWAARNGNLVTNAVATSVLDVQVGRISFSVSDEAQAGQSTEVLFLLSLVNGRLSGNGYDFNIYSQSSIGVDGAVLEMGAVDKLNDTSGVPEPNSLILLGIGAAGMLIRRKGFGTASFGL